MAQHSQLRIGLLGAARIAPVALIQPAQLVPDVQIAALAARDQARAEAFAAQYHIPQIHNSYAALLDDPTIDAIYNPLPNSFHYAWTVRALRAGKHVLCEKPIAANATEAAAMVKVAQETGRVLMEAFHYRYHPLLSRAKALLDSGELGALRHIEAKFCTLLLRQNDIRYRYDLAGGATMDLGCYTVNLIRYLAGAEPTVVRAQAKLAAPQVDRSMEADFRFPNGCTAHILNSFLSPNLIRITAKAICERGELYILNPFVPHRLHWLTVRTAAGKRRERFPGETTYTHQLRAFVQAVRGEATIPTDGVDGVANMRVIDAIYEKAGLKLRGTRTA
ncbi:MAG: Gfo/Idh/MocA family oxidoreductase [Caldilineaceae bacterium]